MALETEPTKATTDMFEPLSGTELAMVVEELADVHPQVSEQADTAESESLSARITADTRVWESELLDNVASAISRIRERIRNNPVIVAISSTWERFFNETHRRRFVSREKSSSGQHHAADEAQTSPNPTLLATQVESLTRNPADEAPVPSSELLELRKVNRV